MKFGFDWPSVSDERMLEIVDDDDSQDGRRSMGILRGIFKNNVDFCYKKLSSQHR